MNWLPLTLNILSLLFVLAVLYVIGGMADNLERIRQILEQETGEK